MILWKIVKSHVGPVVLYEVIVEQLKTREQRVGFIGVLLDTLVVRLLGNILELKVELKLGKKKRKLVNIFNSAKLLTNFEYLKFTKVSLILTTFSQKII